MADYGFKIAQAGYDVGTATDQHLVFTSKLNTQKIQNDLFGTISASIPTTGGTFQIAHNLGYAPPFDAWLRTEGGTWQSIFPNPQVDSTPKLYGGNGFSDGTYINLYVNNQGTQSYNGTIFYIIFLN